MLSLSETLQLIYEPTVIINALASMCLDRGSAATCRADEAPISGRL